MKNQVTQDAFANAAMSQALFALIGAQSADEAKAFHKSAREFWAKAFP